MAPRRARRIPSRRRAPKTVEPPPFSVPAPPRSVPIRLAEPPHSHVVCRNCGRIAAVELQDAERELLVALASQHPEGWSVDGIAFSLTGTCPRCREGTHP